MRLLFTHVACPSPLRVGASSVPRLRNASSRVQLSTFVTRHNELMGPIHTRVQIGRRQNSSIATENENSRTATENTEDEDQTPKPPLAIVFTDIVKSTALWEKDSESMNEAMAIHDDLIRSLADKYAGYEVKQNGDGFMFAFQSAPSALNFCLDIQVQLQTQKWPQALLELPAAEPVTKEVGEEQKEKIVLWKGLRLRMSAHYGEPVCKWNGVIKRMDYLGPAVNRAARFIGVCEGGQIVVSQEFLQELRRARNQIVGSGGPLFEQVQATTTHNEVLDVNELHAEDMSETMEDTRFELRMLGERHFRGVSENQKLYFIVPKSLVGRIDYLPQHHFVQPNKGNLIDGG